MFPLIVAIGIAIAVAVWIVSIYNGLTRLREATKNAFSQIDVQLERRYDLIPNLVSATKGYLSHEQETLTGVIAARASATQARIEVDGDPTNGEALQRLAQADGSLGAAIGRLLAVTENYPELKADRAIADLMEELLSTENKVAFARQGYNDITRRYETSRRSFPAVVISGPLGFGEFFYLEASSSEARERVLVDFDD